MLQRMSLVYGLAKAMALIGVVMRFYHDAVVLQCLDHIAGLLRHDHCIQFTLEKYHWGADLISVQQWCAVAVAFGILLRVADQPIQIVAFEFVRGVAQGDGVADAIEAGAGTEHVMERQGAKSRVAPGTAATNERTTTEESRGGKKGVRTCKS